MKSGCPGIPFFSEGCRVLDIRLVSFDLVYLYCLVFFCCRKNQVIIFLRPEENVGGEKKTNGYANQVDQEHNQRASIFLPINPLKNNTSRFDYLATRWG